MRVVVQRVSEANVVVDGKEVSSIQKGYLLLVGIGQDDEESDITWMAKKISNLRIFEDSDGKMNLNVSQAEGEILSVSQFTICADMSKGNRPGFDQAAKPDKADLYWEKFNEMLRAENLVVKEGVFGAHMKVSLLNDGPVTIILDSKK